MSSLELKKSRSAIRKRRVRSKVVGTSKRPRLAIRISNRHVSAQIIDDEKQKTIVASSTVGSKSMTGNLTKKAELLGDEISKRAKKLKVSKVVLDRGDKLYHGRVKAFSDSARKGGLEF